jgi:hypothetical protein
MLDMKTGLRDLRLIRLIAIIYMHHKRQD